MKPLLPALALGLSTLLLSPVLGQAVPAAPTAPADEQQVRPKDGAIRVNGMAAKANGEVITMNELMIKVAPLQSVLMSRFPRRGAAYNAQLKELRDSILDELIDRAIIFSEFKDRIQAIPEQDVDGEIDRIIQNVYSGDEKLFRDYLKATNLSRAQFKEQQRKEILVQVVRSQHFGDVPPPTDAELRKEYGEWSIANRDRKKDVATYKRIYLPKQDPRDFSVGPATQLKLAEELAAKLQGGADFAELAKLHSQDSHAVEGGLWNDIPRTDLNHEFGFILFESEGNEVVGPFEDPYGFNIIQVVERKFGPAEPFAKVRDEMKKRVESDKKKANFEEWMKKVRARSIIKKMI